MKFKSELIERMYQAKNLLESDLQHPPSIAELAHTLGMNETYLKIYFKAAVGSTVYAFVKEKRVQRAQQLLLEGEMTVSEIAYVVGYKHPTHFTAAFKKATGVCPKDFVGVIFLDTQI